MEKDGSGEVQIYLSNSAMSSSGKAGLAADSYTDFKKIMNADLIFINE